MSMRDLVLQQILQRLSRMESSIDEKDAQFRSLREKHLQLETDILCVKTNNFELREQVKYDQSSIFELKQKINDLVSENKQLTEQLIPGLQSEIANVANNTMKVELDVYRLKDSDMRGPGVNASPNFTKFAEDDTEVKTLEENRQHIPTRRAGTSKTTERIAEDTKVKRRADTSKTTEFSTQTIAEMYTNIKTLEANCQNIPTLKTDTSKTTEKIAEMDTKIKTLEANCQNITTLKTDITNITERIDGLAAEVTVLTKESRKLPEMEQKLGNLESTKMIDALDSRTMAIEERLNDVAQSVTHVSLKLNINQASGKLDQCERIHVNGGLWDERSCRLVPYRDGDYGVGVRYSQEKEGEMILWLNWEGNDGLGRCLGRTRCNLDAVSGMCVVRLMAGQKAWLEAMRWKGKAEIGSCELFCWLL